MEKDLKCYIKKEDKHSTQGNNSRPLLGKYLKICAEIFNRHFIMQEWAGPV